MDNEFETPRQVADQKDDGLILPRIEKCFLIRCKVFNADEKWMTLKDIMDILCNENNVRPK